MVNGTPVMRGTNNWCIPVVPKFKIGRDIAQGQFRVFLDRLPFPGGLHPFFNDALIAATKDDLGIIRVKSQVGTFTTGHRIPVFPVDSLPSLVLLAMDMAELSCCPP